MKAIVAKVPIQAGKEAEFEKFATALAAKVRANEPGNKMYTLCKSEDGEYCFMELYENDEAIAAHRVTDHMKEAAPKFGDFMAGKPEISVFDVVE